jgi:hypothetical protein
MILSCCLEPQTKTGRLRFISAERRRWLQRTAVIYEVPSLHHDHHCNQRSVGILERQRPRDRSPGIRARLEEPPPPTGGRGTRFCLQIRSSNISICDAELTFHIGTTHLEVAAAKAHRNESHEGRRRSALRIIIEFINHKMK